ncbi:DUF4432 family protein [Pseudaminobacter sp. 19-2017]|uniref:DUF4432 family protein n=1 Tax=Pseudaminobacter soli (ex Zhang et al. 2022) TaxID=2831468 RepID=A0A942DVA9_9HYPH|nr:DUF4432 family protein [Pseudaminobacter soli]MBS3647233.1 DUF4432 family protein [Pseudaminobacter soli]
MPDTPVVIDLDPSLFGDREKIIATSGGFAVSAFRYRSAVAALRVENGAGTAVLLPFQGQQIWDATFLGRRLTMHSPFDEPQPAREYLRTYGAFFLHCGGTSMGNPGPTDTHPLHGELPNLPYQSAQLLFGSDDEGAYVDLTGAGRDTLAFHHDFVARPAIRIREGETAFEVSIEVENRAGKPLPFLYLAHINFRPIDGGVLVDTVRDDRADVAVRVPKLSSEERPEVIAYHKAIAADPAHHRTLRPGTPIQPELVLTMNAAAGEDGWAHALQRHPDGTADFVTYRPDELPYAVRWITRGPDQDALGIVLPATAPPDGLAAATANKQLVWIAPGASYRTSMRFGAVDKPSADLLEAAIGSIRGR